MVPASPAQFQFSHALGSPARQGFHLRERRYLGHAGCRHLTFASATPAAKPPPAPARSESQEAPGASSRPQARAGTGLRRRGGAAAPAVRGALAATPSSCAVTAPAAAAGRADRCSLPCRPAPVPAQVPASRPEAPHLPARPLAHHLSGRSARHRRRTTRPAPDERPEGAARHPGRMRALPEGGPHAGGVGALDLLQDPLVLRNGTQTFAALRHLGWKLRSQRGAAPREPRGRAACGASARGRGKGRGGRGGAGSAGARGWRGRQRAGPRPGVGSPHLRGGQGTAGGGGEWRRITSSSRSALVPSCCLLTGWALT